ncbi:MAG: ABC transporter ATP-binding protein [Alphaproteobacteria bacterium]
MSLLNIKNLSVEFSGFKAVDNVSLSVEKGQVLGIVGESGSGKSVTQLAMMGLISYPGKITSGIVEFNGQDLLAMSLKDRRKIIGKEISMIFQDPMTSLNPCYTVEYQILEMLKTHNKGSTRQLKKEVLELLDKVRIPDAKQRLKAYPHELSGGMSQRVMIAMAIACKPQLLVADEPTTALDVTTQAQILDLLIELKDDYGMGLILITHDMGVVAETADNVAVMYAGQLVEQENVEDLFSNPKHPYTQALLEALPERSYGEDELPTIEGVVPGKYDRPKGCLFNPRCRYVTETCKQTPPELVTNGHHRVRCHYPLGQGEK